VQSDRKNCWLFEPASTADPEVVSGLVSRAASARSSGLPLDELMYRRPGSRAAAQSGPMPAPELADLSPVPPPGRTIWLTGLPCSGKSTIATGLAGFLRERGRRVEVLDGDDVRRVFAPDLGYTRQDRDENVRRISRLALLLARNGVTVLVPVIAPYAEGRRRVRELHDGEGIAYSEVYVSAPVEVCAERDVKGLYAAQRSGRLVGLTGADDLYEPPKNPDVVLPTHEATVEECLRRVVDGLSLTRH
jgi:adenylylsulfate kinase